MRCTGVLHQVDSRVVSPVTLALAEFAARHNDRPLLALVHGGGGLEWPKEIDGVRVVPSSLIAYPSWVLLVTEIHTEDDDVTHAGI